MNSNPVMDTVEDIRRYKLGMLKEEHGTWAALNRALGRTSRDATLNQIANRSRDSKTGRIRELGSKQAREIEKALGKRSGWLDRPTDAMMAAGLVGEDDKLVRPLPAGGVHPTAARNDEDAGPKHTPPAPHGKVVPWSVPTDLSADWVLVERRSIKLAAGNGTVIFEHEQLPPLAFRDEYLREKRVRNRNNLVICYAEGDSMEPSFRDRDVLLCDTGQTEIIDGEVYALDYGGELRVKRLRKRFDGGLIILSDNTAKHPPESLSAIDATHIKILGRVLWRGGSV